MLLWFCSLFLQVLGSTAGSDIVLLERRDALCRAGKGRASYAPCPSFANGYFSKVTDLVACSDSAFPFEMPRLATTQSGAVLPQQDGRE